MSDHTNDLANYCLPEVLAAPDIARALFCSVRAVRRMLRAGELPGRKLSIGWRVTRSDLLDALSARLVACADCARRLRSAGAR